MQPSLVYHTTKPCFQRSHISPYSAYNRLHHSATRNRRPPRDQLPVLFTKIQHFTTRLQVFRPLFSAPPCLRCTSGVLPSRSTPDEQPHNSLIPNPKTAAQLPKGVLVYFFVKNLFSHKIQYIYQVFVWLFHAF